MIRSTGTPSTRRRRTVRATLAATLALLLLGGLGLGTRAAVAARHPSAAVYATAHAGAVDPGGARNHVVWLLVLGSDARPGQDITRERADSIHLVGVNTVTGAGVAIGIPRDSYVAIPGNGHNKINASMVYGGPALMARAVADFTGIRPDYVVLTGFSGFRHIVNGLGGLSIDVPVGVHSGGADVDAGHQHLNGDSALWYGRARHGVPGGDLGRSSHQGLMLIAMLAQLQRQASAKNQMAAALSTLLHGLSVKMSPVEAFRLYQAGMAVNPGKIKNCVLPGGFGWAGSQSIVIPDRAVLHRVVRDVRGDATLTGRCPKAY
jgi:LCP family protein required for cell wall assembly